MYGAGGEYVLNSAVIYSRNGFTSCNCEVVSAAGVIRGGVECCHERDSNEDAGVLKKMYDDV